MNFTSIESEYLVALLRSALKGESVPEAPEGLEWKKLVELSKNQQVYSIVLPIINKINVPAEQAQELLFYSQNELVRMIAMNNELENIETELQKLKIDYMLLKGSVIKRYYPMGKMRQMSDVDILYKADEARREKLFEFMLERGYKNVSTGENSDDFNKKPYYTFEFHRNLFFDERNFNPDFSDIWDNAARDSERSCKYHISPSDLYLYTVAHMYKHYILGGFGIRFIADIYIILTKLAAELDGEYIEGKLSQMGIADFNHTVKSIAFAMFDDGDLTDEQTEFANRTMNFGVYGAGGGIKVYYDEYVAKSGNKSVFKFYLAKLFPDRKYMRRIYPVLVRKPYLLPHYYIVRLFDRFFNSRKRIAADIKQLKKSVKENENKAD